MRLVIGRIGGPPSQAEPRDSGCAAAGVLPLVFGVVVYIGKAKAPGSFPKSAIAYIIKRQKALLIEIKLTNQPRFNMDTELEAIVSCQRGQMENFAVLYEAYAKKIHDFVFYRTYHKQTAEDLTSSIFFKAMDKIATFDAGKGNFSSWIYQIARNSIADHYRTQKTIVDIDTILNLSTNDDMAGNLDKKERLKKVKDLLKDLPSDQREIVVMRVWENLSYKEIAEIMGKSEGSCKMSFSRTIAKLNSQVAGAALLLLIINGVIYG